MEVINALGRRKTSVAGVCVFITLGDHVPEIDGVLLEVVIKFGATNP